MTAKLFLDTNILLYSISRDPAETRKRAISIELLERDDLALSVQVLQEFYVQATRVTRPDPIAHDLAVGLIRTWLRFEVQAITVPVMIEALQIKRVSSLSYWDAAIIAAARATGCREVLSEDMGDGRAFDGLVVNNPFR